MYIMIRTIGTENVRPEEPVVLKYDTQFGKVGAFDMGGGSLGYLDEEAPQGCMDAWAVYSRIGDNRIIARVAVVMNGAMLLFSDSPVLARTQRYVRIEREGYGILVPA